MGIIPQRYDKPRFDFAQIHAPLETYFTSQVPGIGSTTSASFVDYPGPIDMTVVKREASTALFISGFAGCYKNTNTGRVSIGIRINGTDQLIGFLFFNQLETHAYIPFNQVTHNLLAPGTYTARLRWATANASVSTDSNDLVQIRFDEGYFG